VCKSVNKKEKIGRRQSVRKEKKSLDKSWIKFFSSTLANTCLHYMSIRTHRSACCNFIDTPSNQLQLEKKINNRPPNDRNHEKSRLDSVCHQLVAH